MYYFRIFQLLWWVLEVRRLKLIKHVLTLLNIGTLNGVTASTAAVLNAALSTASKTAAEVQKSAAREINFTITQLDRIL